MREGYVEARRVTDCIVSTVALVASAPISLGIALAIRSKMGAPVLFRQDRVGLNGRRFVIYKFRTMVSNAEKIGNGYFPSELDLVPPLGAFLRKTSLDEIPQLFNILRGEMSFVGPRPALVDQYTRYTSHQRRRVLVPQGITGLAQVRFRNSVPWSVRICTDLEYVNNIGLRMDLKILLATISSVLSSKGVVVGQSAVEVDDLQPMQGGQNE